MRKSKLTRRDMSKKTRLTFLQVGNELKLFTTDGFEIENCTSFELSAGPLDSSEISARFEIGFDCRVFNVKEQEK